MLYKRLSMECVYIKYSTYYFSSKSVIDMTTHASFLALMVGMGITVNTMNTMEPFLLNHKPWYPYTVQLIGPSIIGVGFVFLSYARNEGLRASVSRELKEKMSYYFRRWAPCKVQTEGYD